MPDFPAFMRNSTNRIAISSQHTPGVEGYIFDGADGSQMAFWAVERDAVTAEHVHQFDEWFVVVEGSYVLTLNGAEIRVGAGQEYFIPKGTKNRRSRGRRNTDHSCLRRPAGGAGSHRVGAEDRRSCTSLPRG